LHTYPPAGMSLVAYDCLSALPAVMPTSDGLLPCLPQLAEKNASWKARGVELREVGNNRARRRGPTDGETPGWSSASARAKQLQAAACGGADAPLPVELPHTTKLRRHPHAGATTKPNGPCRDPSYS